MVKKSRILLSIFLFFILSNALALELRQYCFEKSVSLDRVKIYLSQITLEKDIITLNRSRHCISIGVEESRAELFQKYLSMNYKFKESGNSAIRSRECLFEVETVNSSHATTSKAKFGQKIHLGSAKSDSEGRSTSMIRVMERKLAQLFVNDTLVTISCSIRGKVTAVEVSLGDKKTSLSTSIELTRGQRVDLASVVTDLSNKTSDISSSTGVQYSKTSGSKKSNVFLILK